uniref:Uncharacterized protein n=2 Tax=Tetraselmis sp. GSL018 TaxID=582737 RepID=A0A061R2C8_9CHLO
MPRDRASEGGAWGAPPLPHMAVGKAAPSPLPSLRGGGGWWASGSVAERTRSAAARSVLRPLSAAPVRCWSGVGRSVEREERLGVAPAPRRPGRLEEVVAPAELVDDPTLGALVGDGRRGQQRLGVGGRSGDPPVAVQHARARPPASGPAVRRGGRPVRLDDAACRCRLTRGRGTRGRRRPKAQDPAFGFRRRPPSR